MPPPAKETTSSVAAQLVAKISSLDHRKATDDLICLMDAVKVRFGNEQGIADKLLETYEEGNPGVKEKILKQVITLQTMKAELGQDDLTAKFSGLSEEQMKTLFAAVIQEQVDQIIKEEGPRLLACDDD